MTDRPILIYDGSCDFCKLWIVYWKQLTGDRIAYAMSQEVGADYAQIPPERFAESVQLVFPDGRVLSGAHAVFQSLAFSSGKAWMLWVYENIPGVAAVCEWFYRFVARRRSFFYRATKLLFGEELKPLSYHSIQRLFLKILGCMYLIAFVSFGLQVPGLIGTRGILPAGEFLGRAREALGTTAFRIFPTIFWLNSSDLMLQSICAVGAFIAVLLIVGVRQRAALILLFVLYLSIVAVGQDFMSFQWDMLLLETGFLSIFIGFSPILLWLYRWLLFRLMFESGAVKLLSGDVTWRGLTALRVHYQTQPLPTPLAWYMHQLPDWFQASSVVVVFVIELIAPLLLFAPRRLRYIGAWLIIFLQTLILLTGNYTFFNLLTLALCLWAFDDAVLPGRFWSRTRLADARGSETRRRSQRITAGAIAMFLILAGSLQLIEMFPKILPLSSPAIFKLSAPFGIINTYGLFAMMTTTRPEIVVEGSNDGTSWLEYEFKYKPGDMDRAPRFVAPHQPRLDWQMWFAALGNYRNNPWFVNFVFRLLHGSPEVVKLLNRNPFPSAPPRYIRAVVYDYSFTNFEERRVSGAWWKRELKGQYIPAISLRDVQGN